MLLLATIFKILSSVADVLTGVRSSFWYEASDDKRVLNVDGRSVTIPSRSMTKDFLPQSVGCKPI